MSQFDDFMKRFPGYEGADKKLRPKVSSVSNIESPEIKMNATAKPPGGGLASEKDLKAVGTESAGGADIAGGAMAVAGGASKMASIYNSFETSAESGGPGKAGGAIMGSATAGAKAGMAVAGPWGAAAGAVIGGGSAALAHNSARMDYNDNLKDVNLENMYKEKQVRAQDYAMAKGLGSMEHLRTLNKKKLGLA